MKKALKIEFSPPAKSHGSISVKFEDIDFDLLVDSMTKLQEAAKNKFGRLSLTAQGGIVSIHIALDGPKTDKEIQAIGSCFHSYVHGFIDGQTAGN